MGTILKAIIVIIGGIASIITAVQLFCDPRKWPLPARLVFLIILVGLLWFISADSSTTPPPPTPSLTGETPPTPSTSASFPTPDPAASADYKAGVQLYNDGHYGEAAPYLTTAAQGWYPVAALYLGYCYKDGNGVGLDYASAFHWFERAATCGNAEGQSVLGDCYRNGNGTPEDADKAVYWYQLSADKGNRSGLINLGYCYHHGIGVDQDYALAGQYYTAAKDAGHSYAQKRLDELHADMRK